MSRSKRKIKIIGITTAKSEKEDKHYANKKLRRIVREKLKSGEVILPELKEISDNWDFAKDGKKYYGDIEERYMRK